MRLPQSALPHGLLCARDLSTVRPGDLPALCAGHLWALCAEDLSASGPGDLSAGNLSALRTGGL